MFMAFTSGLRSGDLSRQVGAVVVSAEGDLISTGANDVPKAGGGLYWPTDEDQRDHVRGVDSNAERRDQIVDDILEKLKPDDRRLEEWMVTGRKKLKSSNVMDITEYGRAVHAEMEALLSCARSGTSPRGGTLYSTTFPCHNCAKHIVAAGVKRVVYVEPYPKSQAKELFSDSIRLHNQPKTETESRVAFEPFRGVGPKRFYDLFSMALSWGTKAKRKRRNKKLDWHPQIANARVPLIPNTYIDREHLAILELVELTPEKGSDHV
jgi:deoxycytidylate deaminase